MSLVHPKSLTSARYAVLIVFFLNGLALGGWFARIPSVQERLGVSEGPLGIALLGAAVGALSAMPLTGWLVSRYGSRPVVEASALLLAFSLLPLSLVPNLPLLTLTLLLVGASNGTLDVSMNAHAVAVEKQYERPIMSSFHAAFSFGGLAGSGIGGLAASLGISVPLHFLIVASLISVAVIPAYRRLLPASADAGEPGGPAFAWPTRALLGLGLISFCVLLGEGAMSDWSAVYLDGTLETGAGLAAVGYAAFSLAMAIGRLAGDYLNQLLGPVTLVRCGGVLAAVGLGVSLILANPAAALVGFTCAGAGFSIVFPTALSATGRTPEMLPGPALAAVSSAGYTGFLIGPPTIGFLAELFGLGTALFTVVTLSGAIAVLARAVRAGKA